MIDRREEARFAQEALAEVGVCGALVGQDLECHGPAEPHVGRPIDDAHPAAAEDGLDVIAREVVADESVGWHGPSECRHERSGWEVSGRHLTCRHTRRDGPAHKSHWGIPVITTLPTGSTFAGYVIDAVVARGGMGVVYRATQLQPRRQIALKLIAPEHAADAGYRERFLREADLLASLEHSPSIVPIYAAGEFEGQLYLAMRYMDGPDLGRRLEADGPLSLAQTAAILTPVAAALDAAHEGGLVHRDVKPANILFDSRGRVYLTDFGLTKKAAGDTGLTRPGQAVGTVGYMAPEQFTGRSDPALAPRIDIYALGCVLHACLTGTEPYPRDSYEQALFAHVTSRRRRSAPFAPTFRPRSTRSWLGRWPRSRPTASLRPARWRQRSRPWSRKADPTRPSTSRMLQVAPRRSSRVASCRRHRASAGASKNSPRLRRSRRAGATCRTAPTRSSSALAPPATEAGQRNRPRRRPVPAAGRSTVSRCSCRPLPGSPASSGSRLSSWDPAS